MFNAVNARLRAPILVGVILVCGALFVGVHTAGIVLLHQTWAPQAFITSSLRDSLAAGLDALAVYSALVLAGIAFVRYGSRSLFWVPALLFVALSQLAFQGFLPAIDYYSVWPWRFGVGVAFDFAMILIPALVAARTLESRTRRVDLWDFGGVGIALGLLLVIVLQRQAMTEGSLYFHGYGVRLLGTSFAVGVILGFRPRLAVIGIPFVLLVSGVVPFFFQWATVPNGLGPEGPWSAILMALSGPAGALAYGALSDPIARALRRRAAARAIPANI